MRAKIQNLKGELRASTLHFRTLKRSNCKTSNQEEGKQSHCYFPIGGKSTGM